MEASGSRNRAPQNDELEISLFGPGVGECVIVHLGHNEWMVVDSCKDAARSQPVALQYLDELGVDIESDVKLIVVTHWHDDHIDGVSQLVKAAKNARVAISAALQSREFGEFVQLYSKATFVERTSGISEFESLLREFKSRRGNAATRLGGPDIWALEGLPLRPQTTGVAAVTALSPSSQSMTDALARFTKLLPKSGDRPRRLPRFTPNDSSIVLRIDTPEFSAILGGDLENVADPKRGWNAVIASPHRGSLKSNAVKIAHHGSDNGDHPEIWSEMLIPSPFALLTPFSCGRKPLPAETDVQRMKARTDDLYCTAWPSTRRPPKRMSVVRRTIQDIALSHRAMPPNAGHIRLRTPLNGPFDPSIELFDGAVRL